MSEPRTQAAPDTSHPHGHPHGHPHAPPQNHAPGELHWLERPATVNRIVYALYAVCAALFAVDILVPKHGPFPIEHWFGFYGLYGFIGCVFLVVAAKLMRVVLMRSENYYDR